MRLAHATVSLAVLALALAGCPDTSRWDTDKGESWCGIVTSASFVRAGIAPGTAMRMILRPDELQSAPGRIWTAELGPDKERLVGAELRVIPELLHDPLSTLQFGEGRVKNAIALADLGATQLIVVISLLDTGEAEVRLMRGASPGSAPDGGSVQPPHLFGVFRLERKKGDCGLPGA